MWRTIIVTLVAAVLLALSVGAALAAPITCPPDDPNKSDAYDCKGTSGDDTINGKPGPDYMGGLAGKDTLNGFAGDDKIDAVDPSGSTIQDADTVSGGSGNDTITANDGVKGDDIRCGTGSRDIAYSDKGDLVDSDCEWRRSYDTPRYCSLDDGPPWTGPAGRSSDIQTEDWPPGVPLMGEKIIWCIDGTPRNNKNLRGTTGHSDLLDSIWADKGNDTLNGGVGPDVLQGWSGSDLLKGGAGTDFLYGDDSENPRDWGFFPGAGEDKIYGGPDDDFISAIDNKKDTIRCGGGHDVVQRDKSGVGVGDGSGARSSVTDKVANDCEKISNQGEPALYWCRRFGQRNRR
jgi:Ca2+-binding RTX toxin-like protein